MAVGEKADVADPVEAMGHGVLQEATNEFVGCDCHDLCPTATTGTVAISAAKSETRTNTAALRASGGNQKRGAGLEARKIIR
jgi:hypothetical protein